jgi:hypothetical protein
MTSTLDLTGEEDPETGLGHGTRALGPSDSSDSGSDVVGGPGMDEGLSDEQTRRMPLSTRYDSGRDLGDGDLDSDSDRTGTGERGASGPDGDSPVDQQLTISPGIESGEDEFDDPDADDDEDADAETEREEGSADVSDGAT